MTGHKYLYIHHFDWKEPEAMERFGEEPKSNSVYLAENNKAFYRVILSSSPDMFAGFVLEKKLMEGEYDAWDCDVEEVTIKNLLSLNILNKDLKMMSEDVVEDEEIPQQERNKEFVLLDDLAESLYALKEFDNDFYEALTSMTTKIADAIASPNYIQLTEGLSFNPVTAKIANISIASNLLESHINNKDELALSDLLDAIYYLTLETTRIHKMNKLFKSLT